MSGLSSLLSMWRSLLAVALVAAACTPAERADSTTSTTAGNTTISTQTPPSTVSPAPTTTTTTMATTTTSAPTTTTTIGLEGSWAELPLVTVSFGALGWWDGSSWIDAETEGELPIDGEEDYQVVRLGEVAMTTGGAQTVVCDPLGLIGAELADPELLGEFPGPIGVAISAPWDVQPHLFQEIPDDGSYAGFAAELLSDRGLDVANPQIKQLFRTDLEGDGVNEVLVVAEDVPPNFLMEPGDYSIAFMRKVVNGEVETAVLHETVALDEDDTFAGGHSFAGAGDLNNDGKMELIANSAYFEGFNVTVWEYINDDLGLTMVLETGCGV
jgi:hypothetical protein